MILDTLDQLEAYKNLHPNFSKAISFLQQSTLRELEEKRHDIDGDAVFAIVARDKGKNKEEGRLEIHKKYIDIQVVLDGTDNMGWKPKALCKEPETDYDPETDLQFFSDTPNTWLEVQPNMFAIFFPEDAHKPMISSDTLHKIIVKVAL